MTYPVSPLTTPSRYPDRATYDRAAAHELLDEQYVCHLSFVVDGSPRVLPTLFVRVGDTVYLHGSTASTPLLAARRDDGLPVSLAVTSVDALVLARSQFHHSANYRSLVAHGTARLVTDESTKRAAMKALVDKVGHTLGRLQGRDGNDDRSAHTRPPTAPELAKTAVLALDLQQAAVKRRGGGVLDDAADLGLPYWAGIVPLTVRPGFAQPDPGVTAPPPGYVRMPSPWREPARLVGTHVTLEPLRLGHAERLFTALDQAEVWEHMSTGRPVDVAAMEAYLSEALADPERVPWSQVETATGGPIGTTSFDHVSERDETVAIGHTMIGVRWWRTALNTEAKLLLLTHAFETLGAGRVEWHTDIRDTRSQEAIARLGATREAVLRRHRRRADRTWRDSVQYAMTVDDWPAARTRLAARLAAGQNGAHAGDH
jgi:RimJ/RimL family protein N-acetyltransferase/nitroimidazol reductase NimA-like FMN-containing flavoprotein (pyridoxamine 5'-phosphate oxidase superfamily)